MGYGFPAAIGAKFANPKKEVIDIAGDGSIQMNIQELATAVLNKINVKVIILNNHYLGMVRQWQELFWDKRYSGVCLAKGSGCPDKCNSKAPKDCFSYVPDFVQVAEAYGAVGLRCKNKKDVISVLKKTLSLNSVVFAEFLVEEDTQSSLP